MSLVANERTKLLANFLNNTAVGCLTAGLVTIVVTLALDLRALGVNGCSLCCCA
jgi:hypothetical protein